MIQGSNMPDNKGMRKGISLVEMLVAIVLFGVIASIGYKYYKNFYDTSLAAKKARVSALVDQATQLSNAYDIYVMQTGSAPTVIANLSADTVKILTQTPPLMSEVTTVGWSIDTTTDFNGATADVSFSYPIDGGTSVSDRRDYCNILNNIADTTWSLESLDAAIELAPAMYTAGFTTFQCSKTAADTYFFKFIKEIN